MPGMMHCRVCGKSIISMNKSFEKRFAALRHHRKLKHPKAHEKSIEKGLRTRLKRKRKRK